MMKNQYKIIQSKMKYGILLLLLFGTLVSSQVTPSDKFNEKKSKDVSWEVQHERDKAEHDFYVRAIEKETSEYLIELKAKTDGRDNIETDKTGSPETKG